MDEIKKSSRHCFRVSAMSAMFCFRENDTCLLSEMYCHGGDCRICNISLIEALRKLIITTIKQWKEHQIQKEADEYFDKFWEEQELSEEYIVEAVRRAREEIKDVHKALSELRSGEFDIIKNREELERFLKRLKEDSG